MSKEVPRVRTPVSLDQYVAACRACWPDEMGGPAPYPAVAILWAQYMVETGGAACWNWNLGNVKHVDGDGYDWFDLPGAWEVVGGKRVDLPAGHPGRRFRAYPDLATAMPEKLRFLYRGRYAAAWGAAIRGEPETFAQELKKAGYYTAPAELYAQGMRARFAEFLRRVPRWEDPDEDRVVTVRDLSAVVDGVKR